MEQEREFIRYQLETFHSEQEVCDLLGVSVPELLEMFQDRLDEYVEGDMNGY